MARQLFFFFSGFLFVAIFMFAITPNAQSKTKENRAKNMQIEFLTSKI